MRRTTAVLVAAALSAAGLAAAPGGAPAQAQQAPPTTYRWVQLKPPTSDPSSSETDARDLNERRQAAGFADGTGAVRFSPGGTLALPTPNPDQPDHGWTSVGGINESGAVAGAGYVSRFARPHAFVFSGGQTRDLGEGAAMAINDSGAAVGIRYNSDDVEEAFLWRDGRAVPLGTLGGSTTAPYSTNSLASDINDRGDIVGAARTAGEPALRGFLRTGGVKRDLGTLGGDGESTIAYAVNESRVVVGVSQNSAARSHAFLWRGGAMRDLGTLGGVGSTAQDVNASSTVVGVSSFRPDRAWQRAFVWQGGVMADLNQRVPGLPRGVVLESAVAVNDAGVVLATSCRTPGDTELCEPGATATQRSYLLIPQG